MTLQAFLADVCSKPVVSIRSAPPWVERGNPCQVYKRMFQDRTADAVTLPGSCVFVASLHGGQMPWTLYWHDAHSRRYLAYELSPSDRPLFEHFFT